MKLLCHDSRRSPGVVNKKTSDGVTALIAAVYCGFLDIVKELDREGTDFLTKNWNGTTLIEMARRMIEMASTRRNDYDAVLKYLKERPKVDSLQVIAGHNIARYVRNKADVETLEIPVTVKQFLAGFVNGDTDE